MLTITPPMRFKIVSDSHDLHPKWPQLLKLKCLQMAKTATFKAKIHASQNLDRSFILMCCTVSVTVDY